MYFDSEAFCASDRVPLFEDACSFSMLAGTSRRLVLMLADRDASSSRAKQEKTPDRLWAKATRGFVKRKDAVTGSVSESDSLAVKLGRLLVQRLRWLN